MLVQLETESRRLVYRGETEQDTRELGVRLAAVLPPGAIVALIGDLGAGKTLLVKAIAESMNVPADEVNSPTFTLIQEYAGRIPLRHCDTYRLRHPDEFADLGLDELFATDGIALVEWADRVTEFLPRDILWIRIEITSEDSRQFVLEATGKMSTGILSSLEEISNTNR